MGSKSKKKKKTLSQIILASTKTEGKIEIDESPKYKRFEKEQTVGKLKFPYDEKD